MNSFYNITDSRTTPTKARCWVPEWRPRKFDMSARNRICKGRRDRHEFDRSIKNDLIACGDDNGGASLRCAAMNGDFHPNDRTLHETVWRL